MASGKKEEIVNARGIPRAAFYDDLDTYMRDKKVDEVLKQLQENYSKYKFMEMNLIQNKQAMKMKIPDIRKSLESANFMTEKKAANEALNAQYQLADSLFANTVIENMDHVCLWLGANVMVEYTLDEAKELLGNNLQQAEQRLTEIDEDLVWTKDQITTTEVNIARVYNWDVKTRRAMKALQAAK